MPHIPDSVLHEMLDQLPAATRRSLANIVSGKITYQVHCLGPECKGEVIAYIYTDGVDARGRIQYRVEPVVQLDMSMKLRSVRQRFDGEFGFECIDNDSRIARQESVGLKDDGKPPTREGLEAIYGQLQQDPANYPEINGVKTIDGFQIERIAA